MKYAQLVTGLLIGTALGGSVVASTGGGGSASKDDIRAVVLAVIKEEPQAIMDSLQGFQQKQQDESSKAANEALKDGDMMKRVHDTTNAAFVGPKDAKKVVVEFFDYNCPACHMMFQGIDQLLQQDKEVKVIFREFPIFGELSDTNSKLGLAITKLHPNRYFEFHGKMMKAPGKDIKNTHAIITGMGLDLEELNAEIKKPEYTKMLQEERDLGAKLNIRGTPTLIVGDELVPHALDVNGLKEKLAK